MTRLEKTWLVFSLLMFQAHLQGQDSKWQNHLTLNLGSDSNIYESAYDNLGDFTGRIHWASQMAWPLTAASALLFKAQLGYEGYAAHSDENRLLTDGQLGLTRRLGSSMHLNLEARYRLKSYLEGDQGYSLPLFKAGLTLNRHRTIRINVYGQVSSLDYSQGTLYDNRQLQGGLSAAWAPARRLRCRVAAEGGHLQYERQALEWKSEAVDNVPWQIKEEKQRDIFWRVMTQVEYYNHLLLRLEAGYERGTSNSTGFNYGQPVFALTLAGEFSPRLLYQFRWKYRDKHYDDALNPSLPLRPDSESEELSMATLELSRPISSCWRLMWRAGWYRNESPYQNQYYEKWRGSIGLRWSAAPPSP